MDDLEVFDDAVSLMAAQYDEKALEECKQVMKTLACPHCGSCHVESQFLSGMSNDAPGMVSYHCKSCGKGAQSLTCNQRVRP